MAGLAPPPSPPPVAFGDDDPLRRLRMRLMQMTATVATVVGAAWLCMLGAIPGIIGLAIAKHILVAVLMLELGVDEPRRLPPGGG